MRRIGLPAIFLFLFSVLSAYAGVVEKIAAVVNERVITATDIEDEAAIRKQLGLSADRGQVLDALIEREIVAKEAGRLGIGISLEEVTRSVLAFEDTFSTKDDFNLFLNRYEISINDLSVRFSLSLAVDKVRQQKDSIAGGRYEKWLDEARKKTDVKIVNSEQ